MEIYHARDRIVLSRAIRGRRKYIEATFSSNDDIRLLLSKEQGVQFEGVSTFVRAPPDKARY